MYPMSIRIVPHVLLLVLLVSSSPHRAAAWPTWLASPFTSALRKEGDAAGSSAWGKLNIPPLTLAWHKSDSHRKLNVAQLLAEAEARGRISHCWKSAVDALKKGCTSLRTDDGARSRLALAMASCDNEADGGRCVWPRCSSNEDVRECVRELDDAQYLVYVQYRLHTDVLCLYIQEEAFQERTEAAVQALYTGAVEVSQALQALHDSSGELQMSVRTAAELQASNLAETRRLYDQLQDLNSGQTAAFESLRDSTQQVMRSVVDAGSSLRKLHVALGESTAQAAAAVADVARETAAFQSRTELHTASMLHAMERVERIQQALVDGTAGLGEAMRVAVLLAAFVLFTIPARTTAARLPCIGVVGSAYALRPLVLTVGSSAFLVTVAVVAGVTLAIFACTYRSPEHRLRLLLRGEMRCVLDDTRGTLLEDVRQVVAESATAVMFRTGVARSVQQCGTEKSALLVIPEVPFEAAECDTPPTVAKPRRRTASRTRSCLR
ncbi:putative glucosamine-fructose-6-phosphate aminotransferase [Trypanosoma grayi]|uniref:putative glucosamine-fructose-6-phosphate aminotransferase n=1 Tax=Trypanosoma grayi TaxID=71804 RepID=UPI0004F3F6A7|nr:putative glucosamine-fructose-6-phosphate aminotransferase [Trypanosoma grayi]KEG13429.1 putative glucosamine-fructose-6-phosphate aminotransferase [Trypanosoma grayi]